MLTMYSKYYDKPLRKMAIKLRDASIPRARIIIITSEIARMLRMTVNVNVVGEVAATSRLGRSQKYTYSCYQ